MKKTTKIKGDFLIEMAPAECNSLMCEVNADEIDCNIRMLYSEGKIAFTDGFSGGGCYVYDSEGNIVEYRIPVFRIAEYEINNTKYTAFEVDANYQLWLYEHNGLIGNQYGYWHVPMDVTKAVFEEFRKIFR